MKISPTIRLTTGLVMMTISILLVADILGLMNHSSDGAEQARNKFTEAFAIQLSKVVEADSYKMMRSTIDAVVKRNEDVESIGLRSSNKVLIMQSGDHEKHWQVMSKEVTNGKNQIQLAIYKKNRKWGTLEIKFKPLKVFQVAGMTLSPMVLFVLFMGGALFFVFIIFLTRTLKHLDPSNVIPERVRSALDVLAEGVLILDKNENIVLANIAFAKKIGETPKALLGKKVYELNWDVGGGDKPADEYPWVCATKSKESIKGAHLGLILPNMETCNFVVNCAPILDEKGRSRGILSTFDDVTQLERRNTQLQKMLDLLNKSQKEVKQKNEELEILATQDPLTNALNRRAFFERFSILFEQSKESGEPLSCIMLDIDHFKNINDTYGHSIGDQVIQALADTLKQTVRVDDLVCRYGGEEFCVLLCAPIEEAQGMAERLRQLIVELDFKEISGIDSLKVTSSFGVADSSQGPTCPTELVEFADKALYTAKESGRNKVVVWYEDISSMAMTVSDEGQLPSGYQDVVTDLPVRTLFLDGLRQLIENRSETNQAFALFMIDIDMFKRINNTLGHNAGDAILKEISQRLKQCIRGNKVMFQLNDSVNLDVSISRLGGDEFGILVSDFPNNYVLKEIIDRILNQISEPYNLESQEFHLSCSIGISQFPHDGDLAETLLKNAELAMYHAKKKGRHGYYFYSKEIDTSSIEILQLEYELQHAVENSQFVLHYQPKINAVTQEISGFEALIRWDHPRTGLVPPIQFISLAEDLGTINQIGEWVIRKACEDIKHWNELGYDNIYVSVNLSIMQFKQGNLYEQIEGILQETGVDPHFLEFEITESTIMENLQYVVHTLHRLHALGLRISIDDFGTGYSSLSYIKRLPVDTLKIDRSFIQNINVDEDDRAIVMAIIAMAKAMSLSVIAEGVEDLEQVKLLKKLKCHEMQGYYFSKPIEHDRATALLEQRVQEKSGNDQSDIA